MGIINRIKRLETQLPLDDSDRKQAAAELDEYMNRSLAEYNSPEEQEKRQREYRELCVIGRKRKEAFYAGIPMDTYPLPWEKKGENENESDKSVSSERRRISDEIKKHLGIL